MIKLIAKAIVYCSKRNRNLMSRAHAFCICYAGDGAPSIERHYSNIIKGWYDSAQDYASQLAFKDFIQVNSEIMTNKKFKEVYSLLKFINGTRKVS